MKEKREKLYDGITGIREELVERAARTEGKKRGGRKWYLRAAAAVLAVVFIAGIALRPGGGNTAYAIAEAKYPKMADYPDEQAYTNLNGFDHEGFSRAYEAWQDDLQENRAPAGYADGLQTWFAAGIRQFLSGAGEENRAFSPVNVYMALAMLAELTDGESRRQILDLLGSGSVEDLRQQATAVWKAQYRDDGAVTRVMADSVWLNEDVRFVESTMKTLAEHYYASSFRGEMGSEEFDRALREWLNEQTGGLLAEQAEALSMDADTLLALASTIYYRAKWHDEFRAERNTQETFHAASGDVERTFMHQSFTNTYYWGDNFSAISRSMEADGGRMWFLLPDEGVSVDDLLADDRVMEFLLMEGTKSDWEGQKYLIVNQSVPKFDVASQLELSEGLRALGVTDVFDPAVSDFTPLTTDADDVFVSQAQHDVRVIIDEEGVEAAAYTVLMAAGSGAPPEEEVDFVLDRPFLFIITGADSLPLFAGVVNLP